MKRRLRWFAATGVALALIAVAVAACVTFERLQSPASVDAEAAAIRDANAFDHFLLDQVLKAFVDGEGRVDYAALRADPDALDKYVAILAVVGPTTDPALFATNDDKLAYYINAYNAFVLFSVRERPALISVHDNKVNFFYGTSFALDGGSTNLYDLENTVIRGGFADPRVHFALNCASVGCPKLPATAFTAAQLQVELDREQTRFLAEARNVSTTETTATVSQIFEWYAVDFKPSPIAWLSERHEAVTPEMKLAFRPWDWTLNERPGSGANAAQE